MSFDAKAFRVLIASPSDVRDEREVIAKAIHDWNARNAEEKGMVVLPVGWETHTAPETGRRPQAIINDQIVDKCDMLIGVFWTRLGTDTGEATSGTLEEIERLSNEEKPCLVYFSEAPARPAEIDLDQLKAVRDFRKELQETALVETYASLVEFQDKLTRQLDHHIRQIGSVAMEGEGASIRRELEIQILGDQGEAVDEYVVKVRRLSVSDIDDIPEDKDGVFRSALLGLGDNSNKGKVRSIVFSEAYAPISFYLVNKGSVGARDIHVQVVVTPKDPKIPTYLSSRSLHNSERHSGSFSRDPKGAFEMKEGQAGTYNFEVSALQPQREIQKQDTMGISAEATTEVEITATVYADTLPRPLVKTMKLKVEVVREEVSWRDLLPNLGE